MLLSRLECLFSMTLLRGAGGGHGGRGLHSSTFRHNVSAFCGIGVQLGIVYGVFRR
jgi:hypothetical protein